MSSKLTTDWPTDMMDTCQGFVSHCTVEGRERGRERRRERGEEEREREREREERKRKKERFMVPQPPFWYSGCELLLGTMLHRCLEL